MLNIEKIKENKTTEELIEFGIINIDKPSGPTSFDVSNFIKKELKIRKTSHFGTLDPKVTGVLPIALNRACKLTGFFLGENKEYVGIMRIHKDIPLEEIENAIKKKFVGKIMQKPPVKSRVKREEREREVKRFEILEKKGKDFLFVANVQGGTYIRKLIDDLGIELKIGAHMLELRRIKAGIFEENNKNYLCVNLYDFQKAIDEYKKGNEESLRKIIIPGEIICEVYDIVYIKEGNLKKILTGKSLSEKDLEKNYEFENGKIISVFLKERFIGMYKVVNQREIFAKPEFVMQSIN